MEDSLVAFQKHSYLLDCWKALVIYSLPMCSYKMLTVTASLHLIAYLMEQVIDLNALK